MITSYQFGSITIDGKRYDFDVKIVGGKVVPDWWRSQGHLLQVEDITDILAERPEVLVVGQGASGNMRLAADVEETLAKYSIRLIAENSGHAVDELNRLSKEGVSVAGAFHLTC